MALGIQPAAIGGRDTVLRRATGDGRAVTFLAVDLIPGRPLRLWGALVETSGAAGQGGVFVRLGILGAQDGWSVTQLLVVALARFEAELARTGEVMVAEIVQKLELAAAVYREPQASKPVLPVAFEPPGAASSTVARAGLFAIPLCADPEGQGGGVTPGQLLVVLDLALSAWLPVTPWRRSCWEARRAVRAALLAATGRTLEGATAQPPGGM